MPTKTLYVKDLQLWEEASRLAGHQGLSGVIMRLIAKWVADKKRHEAMNNVKVFAEIELWVGGYTTPSVRLIDNQIEEDHKIVFTGRLLGSSPRYEDTSVPHVQVYEMKSGRLLVYEAFHDFGTDQEIQATYKVFSNVEELQHSSVFSDYEKTLDQNWEGLGEELRTVAAENEKRFADEIAAINLQFQRDVADALGAELVVRIE